MSDSTRAFRLPHLRLPEQSLVKAPGFAANHRLPLGVAKLVGMIVKYAMRNNGSSRMNLKETVMGLSDDISNKADEFGGKAKEAAGEVTNDESLKNEGKADQAESKLKQGVEEVKKKASELFGN